MASFSVVNNITAAYAQTNLQATQLGLQKALSRLSSGFRINQSGDDAAGLAVANGYRNSSAILSQGIRNANDGMSDLQIKDGALGNISNLLDRLATLATQASSGKAGLSLANLNSEFDKVTAEITREAKVAGLDTQSSFSVFVSNSTSASDGMVAGTVAAVDLTSLGINASAVDTQAHAIDAVSKVAAAVATLGGVQSSVGSLQNNLQFAISLAQSKQVNTQAAESRIRDANVAEEAANMTRFSILSQSGIAALAQANQSTSSVLALLR
ncbi:MAG: flagellin [Acidobacteria bacterium]|nr:flagellin [Acidobacteriota bacterium]